MIVSTFCVAFYEVMSATNIASKDVITYELLLNIADVSAEDKELVRDHELDGQGARAYFCSSLM